MTGHQVPAYKFVCKCMCVNFAGEYALKDLQSFKHNMMDSKTVSSVSHLVYYLLKVYKACVAISFSMPYCTVLFLSVMFRPNELFDLQCCTVCFSLNVLHCLTVLFL